MYSIKIYESLNFTNLLIILLIIVIIIGLRKTTNKLNEIEREIKNRLEK